MLREEKKHELGFEGGDTWRSHADQGQRCSCDDRVSTSAVSYDGVLHPSLRQDQSVCTDV